MQKESESFPHVVKSAEKERFAGGLGVLDASGVEAGGRVAGINETRETISVTFSYYAMKSEKGLILKTGEEPVFDKKAPCNLHRIQIECLVLEENPESLLILFPDPKKIAAEIRSKK